MAKRGKASLIDVISFIERTIIAPRHFPPTGALLFDPNFDLVKSLGADHVIIYKKQDFTANNERYDVIYDTVGKSSFGKSKKVLKENGMYISPVMKFPLLLQMLTSSVIGKKKAKFGASGLKSDDDLRNLLSELVEIFKAEMLKTVIDREFSLEKVAQAHQYIGEGHKKGNVVIGMGV